eukprot:CAMPEP_0113887750 /NCGR_PEP_ID=MMETSP0780_2-20120614/12417_1 /TAXON_ID=652834 /ORGANISM="Palpitomonas bilix" /LENGTH=293 /DNA_ID=CAMNT_0000876377 /DNA_START=68 /DNA_END=950 /DNA_ORIENTATION=- /assembly_acc=CAM_ASM_000599
MEFVGTMLQADGLREGVRRRGVMERKDGEASGGIEKFGRGRIFIAGNVFQPDYVSQLKREVGERYEIVSMRRPNGKRDGVAIMFNRDKMERVEVIKKYEYENDVGHRVLLAAHAYLAQQDGDKAMPSLFSSSPLCFVVTHFTYPHHDYDINVVRVEQAKQCAGIMHTLAEKYGGRVVMGGDFNGNSELDDPAMHIVEGVVHPSSVVSMAKLGTTHITHNSTLVSVDRLYRSSSSSAALEESEEEEVKLKEEKVDVYPLKYGRKEEWPSFSRLVSDHRPVVVVYSLSHSPPKSQ